MAICNKQHRYLQGLMSFQKLKIIETGDDISVPLVLMKRD